jgi:hypothetical protein
VLLGPTTAALAGRGLQLAALVLGGLLARAAAEVEGDALGHGAALSCYSRSDVVKKTGFICVPRPAGKPRNASMLAVQRGSSIRTAARRFAVRPYAAIKIKLMQRVRTTGSAAPARFGGHRRPLLAP